MRNFLDWYEDGGFYVSKVWDHHSHEMIGSGKIQLFDHQKEILRHLFTFDERGRLPYSTIILGMIKKSGKSTLGSMVAAWIAEEGPPSTEIFTIANDLEQTQDRQFADLKFHYEMLRGWISPKKRIDFPNRTFIQAIAKQATSAAGARHFLSLWDELWGYQTERGQMMWAEMTPPPTIPNAFRLVTTYAGYENKSELLYERYEVGWLKGEVIPELAHLVNTAGDPVCRRVGRLFVMWDDVPRYPWQTEEYYEDQLLDLRPSDFLRMHRNQWVSSTEAFIPVELWDRAMVLEGQLVYMKDDRRYRYPISLGVDIGTKVDCSAVVGTYSDVLTGRAGIAGHRIWTPGPEEDFDIEETVEAYILDIWLRMNVIGVLYDPVQFHRSAVTLKKRGVPMIEFPQTTTNMTQATQILYDRLRAKGLDVYPDKELRDHIRMSPAKQTPRGFRIVKEKHAKFKIDAAIALVMSLWYTSGNRAVDTGTYEEIRVPFADVSLLPRIPTIRDIMELKLPPQLRS